jgi:predicted transcriptional regulator
LLEGVSDNRISNMKTIAVTVDEATLKILDELAGHAPRGRTRSALVRAALRDFADRERRCVIEEREREILRKHRTRLARDARGLVHAQARP